MKKYLKSVGIPVIYYILVETDDENDDNVLASAKQMVLDILEENWDDQFGYNDQVMEFEGFEWVQGEYAHTIEERDEEASEASGDQPDAGVSGDVSPVQ
jgi:hypothetical protein